MVSKRWERAQRITLAAYPLSLPGPEERLRQDCQAVIDQELTAGLATSRSFIDDLPIVTLQILKRIRLQLDRELRGFSASSSTALDRLLKERKGGKMPPFNAVLANVYHILYGNGEAMLVPRMAKSVFGVKSWGKLDSRKLDSSDSQEQLEPHLNVLRSPWSGTEDRVRAVAGLRSVFGEAPFWNQCENLLYHLVFAWPLLVNSDSRLGDGKATAISLPVGVDVNYDPEEDQLPVVVLLDSRKVLDVGAWRPSLYRAAEAAKRLLKGQRRNCGEHFRDRVGRAQVTFDFRYAERIATGFALCLNDSSMEAFFSQVVLSRLLGRTPALSGVATGQPKLKTYDSISEHAPVGQVTAINRTREYYDFEWPGRPLDKMWFVFFSWYFENIVYPSLDKLEETERDQIEQFIAKMRAKQTANVLHAAHLSHLADCLQQHRWREHTYIRCPDIGWAIHGRDPGSTTEPNGENRLPHRGSRNIRWCIDTLRNNRSPVLEIPEHISPLDVAAALGAIGSDCRQIGRHEQGVEQHYPISCMFIRATPEQVDARFWHVVWKAMAASPDKFEDVYLTGTPERAAEHLAAAFNQFKPSTECPSHRSPDLLIVIGADQLMQGFEKKRNPLRRPCAFDPVLEALSQLLEPLPAPRLRMLLGSTRIIVLRHDVPPLAVGKEDDSGVLDRLSTFRFGFTQQMASLVLPESEGKNCRDTLEDLESKGLLRKFAGEYHIPGLPGRDVDSRLPAEDLQRRHYSAGIAFAPYLSLRSVPGVNHTRAMLPEFVNEAQYHLQKASYYARQAGNRTNAIKSTQQRLQRFFEVPGWYTVGQLRKGDAIKDAYERATRLLSKQRKRGYVSHPANMILTADTAQKWWLKLCGENGPPEEIARLAKEIRSLYKIAREACTGFKDEEEYNVLHVITNQSLFLEQYGTAEERQLSAELNEDAWLLLDRREDPPDGSGVLGEWYERRGDKIDENESAAEVYRLGTMYTTWHQLWIKLCGCYSHNHQHVNQIIGNLGETVDKRIEAVQRILTFSEKPYLNQRSEGNVICDRWDNGLREFQRCFKWHEGIQKLLSEKYFLTQLATTGIREYA